MDCMLKMNPIEFVESFVENNIYINDVVIWLRECKKIKFKTCEIRIPKGWIDNFEKDKKQVAEYLKDKIVDSGVEIENYVLGGVCATTTNGLPAIHARFVPDESLLEKIVVDKVASCIIVSHDKNILGTFNYENCQGFCNWKEFLKQFEDKSKYMIEYTF